MFSKIYYGIIFPLFKIFTKLNDNKFLFESYYGKQYSCNPKWFYLYILEHHNDTEIVWVINDKSKRIQVPNSSNIDFTKRKSISYLYHLATSKYWIVNSNLHPMAIPKKGTCYLQTWHGTALKKIGLDVLDTYNQVNTDKLNWKKDAKNWTYILAPTIEVGKKFKSAFDLPDNKILNYNYPRNSILLSDKKGLYEKIFNQIGLKTHKKVILYAPTFRGTNPVFDLQINIDDFRQQLGEEYILLIRKHSNITEIKQKNIFNEEFVIDVSDYDDIQELYLISDLLITDYSSVFFDYALLERPMIFFPYDYEEYKNNLRGLYYNYEEVVPGPIVYDSDDLISEIKKIKDFKDSNELKKFNIRFNNLSDKRPNEQIYKTLVTN